MTQGFPRAVTLKPRIVTSKTANGGIDALAGASTLGAVPVSGVG